MTRRKNLEAYAKAYFAGKLEKGEWPAERIDVNRGGMDRKECVMTGGSTAGSYQ
ncbi:hypothetical protein [Siminovitchia sp. 179-K 8D1 HS]|uniref:hypothetical protein n=1 Tax=Siminovitchia sp. 179-K 8D1 HS TaxID=3142385 RepID=UPI0039A2AE55